MHKFVLRTSDAAWIARHDGTTDADGRVTVYVAQVERVMFAGREHLRADFTADPPNNAANGHLMYPAAWAE